MTTAMGREPDTLKVKLIRLYNGASVMSRIFRFTLLTFDLLTLIYFVASSGLDHQLWVQITNLVIVAFIAADFLARLWIAPNKSRYMSQLTTWADIIVVITLLLPFFVEEFFFLRVLRALRLLRSYHVLRDLRSQSRFFKKNEELITSIVDLSVFVFIVSAVVYVLQVHTNPQITNYVDALYFTITTLTTTGFGDITLQGPYGRLLAIIIMVVGVALFLRLVQTIFRPPKAHHKCQDCGLTRHDPDAVHCKHCGKVIAIETEGL